MLTDIDSARSYLNSNSSVLIAGRNLHRKLAANFQTLELAISELEQAAESQDGRASSYRAFMFPRSSKLRRLKRKPDKKYPKTF
jgi:hypothetical protein